MALAIFNQTDKKQSDIEALAVMVKKSFIQIVVITTQTIVLIFFSLLLAFFVYMFSTRINLPYDENGRYFDAELQ